MKDFLVAGLGNPGRKYLNTRHNIGFMVLDELACQLHLDFRHHSTHPSYDLAQRHIGSTRVFFLKPLEFMNRSGGPVRAVLSYYRISPSHLLVIHDDLDIDFGRLKFVRSGGHGGHNGIRSIIDALGTKEFPRLKIGIGRPKGPIPPDKYVLSRFLPEERETLSRILEVATQGVIHFLENGIDSAMNKFNGVIVGERGT